MSTQDVQDLMDGERDVDVSDENREETLAYQRMTTYVQSLDYYQQLQRRGATYQPDQDVSGWIRFSLTAYHQQAQAVQLRMDQPAAVWELLAAFADHAGLDERVITALHDVAVVDRVRRARYEKAENLTLQQAQRDLRDLTAAGLLVPVGRTRARYYIEGPNFPAAALDRARTPFTLTTPYPSG